LGGEDHVREDRVGSDFLTGVGELVAQVRRFGLGALRVRCETGAVVDVEGASSIFRAIRLINHPHLVGRRSSRGSRSGGRIGRKDGTGSQEQERERKKPYGEKASGYHIEVTSFW